jgi:hypothetical protein
LNPKAYLIDPQYTRIQSLLDQVNVDDFSHEELSHLSNKIETLASRKKVQIAMRQFSRGFQVLNTCTPEIASHLIFQDAISLLQVCHSTRLWQRSVLLSMVLRLLGRHFSNPRKMRNMMRRIGAIISGSSALWLVDSDRASWEPGDLDIYVPRNMAQTMIDFLLQEGYQLASIPDGEHPGGPYIDLGHLASVTKLIKGDCRIDLMESLSQSSVLPITLFHNTIVMNYMTADSISMMYPKLTFQRKGVRANPDRRSTSKWQLKYSSRGFYVFFETRLYPPFQHSICKHLPRKTGDKFCLLLNFGDTGDQLGRDELFAEWKFVSDCQLESKHGNCTPGQCIIAHYYRNRVDAVGIEVIARATYAK